MNARKTIFICCDQCGKGYEKHLSEYNRNIRLGRRSFCGISCSMLWQNANTERVMADNSGNLKVSRTDALSPFRYHLRKAKNRDLEFNISLEYLREVWFKQGGKCVYTDVYLHNKSQNGGLKTLGLIHAASLDRISSDRGYIKGNVQFISLAMNLAKNTFSDGDVREFIRVIREGVVGHNYEKSPIIKCIENVMPIS